MFEVINFDSWNVYNGASEGSGRSEKIWLISDTGEIGLFKYPKIDLQRWTSDAGAAESAA